MLSYTSGRNLYGSLTNNTQAANLTLGDTLINEATRQLIGSYSWPFRFRTQTITSVASTQGYTLAQEAGQIFGVTYTVGTTVYTLQPVPDREAWDYLNGTPDTSDSPSHYYVSQGSVYLWPTPASSSNTITVQYEARHRDLSIADETGMKVVAIANGATAMTVSTVAATADMVGRYIRITQTTAAGGGDGRWYEIGSFTNATTIGLSRKYQGTTLAAATAACVVAQCSIVPEDYQALPVWKAVEMYFTSVNPDATRAALYRNMYDDGVRNMKREYGSTTRSPSLETGSYTPNPQTHYSV